MVFLPGLAIMLAGGRHLGLAAKPHLIPLCRWLSQFSYPCYILHMPLLLLVHHAGAQVASLGGPPVPAWGLSFAIVLTFLAFIGPALERFSWRGAPGVLSGETRK